MAVTITVNNSNNSADVKDCEALEKAVFNSKGFANEEEARKAICALCQAGGTNNAQGSLSVTWSDPASTPPSTIKLTLKEIKDIIKTTRLGITLRQYARTRAQQCHDIAVEHDIPGDLYKKLVHMFGPISRADSYWCCSFQMDTDVCPANVKDLLVKHYNSLFKKP